ncbi:Major capsid protein [Pectobacterium carotovorum subsp. carotovorum]|nr:Major capsid protein [Pectobacterium carotovorum subsp. carotovorum]
METIFDTSVLVQVVPNLKTSQNWLLDRFFPNVVTYETEEVAIDVDVGLRRMAPFVSPLVEGKLVESRKYQTNTFKPAYIKDKRAPDLRKPIRRQIGERIGGEYTAAEREMLNLQFEMTDQIDMINRRLEWMAASALVSGTVTVTGEGYETKVVDFGRSPDLTITLSGSDKWPLDMFVKVDDGKVVKFDATYYRRNNDYFQAETSDRDGILSVLQDAVKAKSKIIVGLSSKHTDNKHSFTANVSGSTKAVNDFIKACKIELKDNAKI